MRKIKPFTSDEIVSMDNFNDRIKTQNSNIDIMNKEINKLDNVAYSLGAHTDDKKSHVTQENKARWDNISNPNLLINGDFKVWQRGNRITTEKNKWTYTADRFRVTGVGTIEKNDKGLYVSYASGGVEICYILDDADYIKLLGKRITVSYCKNDIEYILYSAEVAGQTICVIPLNMGDTLNWVKAEIGEVATPFVQKPYVQELADCQRYYQKYITKDEQAFKSVSLADKYVAGFSIPEMRVFPNIKTRGINAYVSYGLVPVELNGAPYSSHNYLNLWFFNPSYPNALDGYLINKSMDGTGGIFLDAEIY